MNNYVNLENAPLTNNNLNLEKNLNNNQKAVDNNQKAVDEYIINNHQIIDIYNYNEQTFKSQDEIKNLEYYEKYTRLLFTTIELNENSLDNILEDCSHRIGYISCIGGTILFSSIIIGLAGGLNQYKILSIMMMGIAILFYSLYKSIKYTKIKNKVEIFKKKIINLKNTANNNMKNIQELIRRDKITILNNLIDQLIDGNNFDLLNNELSIMTKTREEIDKEAQKFLKCCSL